MSWKNLSNVTKGSVVGAIIASLSLIPFILDSILKGESIIMFQFLILPLIIITLPARIFFVNILNIPIIVAFHPLIIIGTYIFWILIWILIFRIITKIKSRKKANTIHQ